MTLVIQVDKQGSAIEMVFDKTGLEFLKNVLSRNWNEPVSKGNNYYDFDHVHFASKQWGGDELTPEFTSPGFNEIHAVKMIYLGKQETNS